MVDYFDYPNKKEIKVAEEGINKPQFNYLLHRNSIEAYASYVDRLCIRLQEKVNPILIDPKPIAEEKDTEKAYHETQASRELTDAIQVLGTQLSLLENLIDRIQL